MDMEEAMELYSEQATADLVNLFYWTKRGTVDSEEIVKELLTRSDFHVEADKYYHWLKDGFSRNRNAIEFRNDLNAVVDKLKAA
jgi:hypothetical protein